MDKQEAIKILKDMVEYQWGFSDEEKSEGIEALKIAIESLEKECEKEGKNKLTCERNICLKNEYSNIGCEDCVVTKGENNGDNP